MHVFDLEGHAKATRVYAWSTLIEGSCGQLSWRSGKNEEQAPYPLGDHCGLSGWRCAGHCVHIDRPKALTVRRLPIGGAHLPAGLNVRSSASRGARRGPHPLQQVANGRRSLFDLDGVRRVAKLGLGREYYDETQSGPTLTLLAPALR